MIRRRFYSLMSFAAAALLGTALFITSEHVQRTEKELSALQEKVQAEADSVRILNAEWAYLNRPDRLEQLSINYLQLSPASADKMASSVKVLPEVFVPALPGIKPKIVPAGFVQMNERLANLMPQPVPATTPAVARARQPLNTPRFNQLIDRIATGSSNP